MQKKNLKRKFESIDAKEENVWTVKKKDRQGLHEFKKLPCVPFAKLYYWSSANFKKYIGRYPNSNYSDREYLTIEYLKIMYDIDDIEMCKGRSGPDCCTAKGQKKNIEIKTSCFKQERKTITAKYVIGQFSRQNTKEIRKFNQSIDGIAYVIFVKDSFVPIFVIFLHGKTAMFAHQKLVRSKQFEFIANQPTGPKGGRDTISIGLQDLCKILTQKKTNSALPGFDAWIFNKKIVDWPRFLAQLEQNQLIVS